MKNANEILLLFLFLVLSAGTADAADQTCNGRSNNAVWQNSETLPNPPDCDAPLIGKKTCNATYSNSCVNGHHISVMIFQSCLSSNCKQAAKTTPAVVIASADMAASAPAPVLSPGSDSSTVKPATANAAMPAENKNIVWGVNGHPFKKGPTVFKDDRILQVMKLRGLKSYRVDVPLADDTNSYAAQDFKTLMEKARAQGITLKPVLSLPFTWGDRTDNGKYPKGDRQALYDQGFKRTYDFVNQFKYQVKDWELGNEINLSAKDAQGNLLFGKGWAAAEFDTPAMNDWASLLKGMSDAVNRINKIYGLKLRTTLNTTSTMFGFLDFMAGKNVRFDVISYHYYEPGSINPHSYWGGAQPSFDLFKKLASYKKPVVINELNCQEIYRGGFENTLGKPLTNSCYKSLDIILNYFSTQNDANIEEISLYEILDDPELIGSESMFGLMYSVTKPTLSMAVVSKYTGGYITPGETTLLKQYGLQ